MTLLVAAIIDEVGNDRVEKSEKRFLSHFFAYRFTLKVTVLLISLIIPDFITRAVGLWVFDFGYENMGVVIRRRFRSASHMQDYNRHL
ncbi:MAG: hypothetical protein ACFFD6_06875, partial [Candidatus Thorarchaeota archaeon]